MLFVHVALFLRSLIKDVDGNLYNPCIVSSDICNENVEKMMPAELHNILCLLITGKSQDSPDENNSQHANILAVAQNIIYMISKHVALAIATKHLTGSKMIINILNNLITVFVMTMLCQHKLLYIANDIISKMSDEGWFVPSNIFGESFLHAEANNINTNEETKSNTCSR